MGGKSFTIGRVVCFTMSDSRDTVLPGIKERAMTEVMYFQWQNDALLQTIYPLREMKLRDFLIYYQEIDLWAEYKDKDIASLEAEYVAAQEKATAEAYRNY